jgi:hypothetical protein
MSEETPAEEYAFVGDITDYWTYTQVRDRLLLMPGLTDPAMRLYLIVRSMIGEKKKHLPGQGLRRMTIDQMCFLLSRDTGKPVSVSLMYQILTLLKDLDLMVPLDTKQDVGACQMKGKEKAVRGILRGFLVRDLPPVPYTGWRNVWDKLNHYRPDWRENPPQPPMHVTTTVVDDNGRTLAMVSVVPQDVAFQDSGTDSESSDQGDKPDKDPFQESGKSFQDSGTPVQEAGTDSPSTSEDADPKEGSPTTVLKKNDAPSGRSPGGVRSTDTSGSSQAGGESGFAAAAKESSSSDQEDGTAGVPGQRQSGGPKLSRQQLAAVRSVESVLPPVLMAKLPYEQFPGRNRPAVLEALESRTVEQLRERAERRWLAYGYEPALYDGTMTNPIGAALELIAPSRYCPDLSCEDGFMVDTGAECRTCLERRASRRAARAAGQLETTSSKTTPSGRMPECVICQAPFPGEVPARGECLGCEREAVAAFAALSARLEPLEVVCKDAGVQPGEEPLPDPKDAPQDDQETARLRALYARQFGTADQVEAYCGEAPF